MVLLIKLGIPWIKIIPEITEQTIDKDDLNKINIKVKSKIKCGIGFWSRSTSEMLLIATRGTPKRLTKRTETPVGLLIDDEKVFYHPIGKHSEKPCNIHRMAY